MFNKIKEIKIHLLIIVFATGFFLGINLSELKSAENSTFKYLEYFHFVYNTITNEYVEETNPRQLLEGAMAGLLNSLNDPYSRFLNETNLNQFKEAVTGEFVGIGIEVTARDNDIIVIAPIDDSPAQKAGIMTGDKILQINDIVVQPENFNDALKEIKGKPGTELRLKILREGFSEPVDFKIKRSPIQMKSVKFAIMKETPNTAYIKLSHFYSSSPDEMAKAIESANNKKISKIILDLRGNPGGDMDAAVQIADMFLEKGKIIVTTKGKDQSKNVETFISKNDPLYSGKLLVLVDEGSASSSEILSGALKDNGRGKLIGEKTFGKALVQRVVTVEEGKSAFTLTINKYYTPSGAMIHKKGIQPDFEIKTDAIPAGDRKNLGRIINDDIIGEFVKANPSYDKYNVAQLMELLKEKNLPVSEKVAAYFYKMEFNRDKPSALYDLEFDNQLREAMKKINE